MGYFMNEVEVSNAGQTVFKGEAVHDGHPIKPVVVSGVPHREDAGAIAQQRALQPAGNVPWRRRSTGKPSENKTFGDALQSSAQVAHAVV